jgi:hypothetical protein
MSRSADTSVEIRAMQVEAFKKMTPMRRVEMAIELSELTHSIHQAGVARRKRLQIPDVQSS